MAIFRLGPPSESATFVRGEGLYLRPAEMRDFPAWSLLRERSRVFLMPWEPTWPADDLTRASFRRRLRRHSEEMEQDEAYSLLLFRESDDALLGGLTIGQIRRGVAQAATLGYWMGAPYAARGYVLAALSAGASAGFVCGAAALLKAGGDGAAAIGGCGAAGPLWPILTLSPKSRHWPFTGANSISKLTCCGTEGKKPAMPALR